MRNTCFLAAALLLAVTPAARADSIQLVVNTSVLAAISSPNDNYWGEYSTALQEGYYPSLGNSRAYVDFSSVSVDVPAGDTITSATIKVLGPDSELRGTGFLSIGPSFRLLIQAHNPKRLHSDRLTRRSPLIQASITLYQPSVAT